MPQYLLQAGNTPALTLAEAQAMVDPQAQLLAAAVVTFKAQSDQAAKDVFKLLGAAVKLIKVNTTLKITEQQKLEEHLLAQLLEDSPKNIQFSLTYLGQPDSIGTTEPISLMSLKKALKEQQVKARFIEGSSRGLSAAVLLHQPVTELVVFSHEEQLLVGQTLAVQNIDHWTLKDRGKSYADRKKGMLPPKIARIMVNLALGKEMAADTLVYDPFCGTGTVLIEALERGAEVVGSDLDRQAIAGTQENLEWFAQQAGLKPRFTVFQSQVAQAKLSQLPGKVDAIVTEPFLGKPNPKPNQLPGIFKGLEKMYLGAFNQWRTLLKDGAKVVMVFPRAEIVGGQTFDLKNFVDKLPSRGYTSPVDLGTLRYARKGAIIQRDIGIFTYSPGKQPTKE